MFVVELDNNSSARTHFTELLPGGAVKRGAPLPGYSTSPFVDAADGSTLFWRDDALVRVGPDGASLARVHETGRVNDARTPWVHELAGSCPGVIALTWRHIFESAGRIRRRSRFVVVDVG